MAKNADVSSASVDDASRPGQKRSLRQKIASIVWDSLDKSPEERKFVAKIDWWILSYCCISYFCKYLDQTNVSFTVYTRRMTSTVERKSR